VSYSCVQDPFPSKRGGILERGDLGSPVVPGGQGDQLWSGGTARLLPPWRFGFDSQAVGPGLSHLGSKAPGPPVSATRPSLEHGAGAGVFCGQERPFLLRQHCCRQYLVTFLARLLCPHVCDSDSARARIPVACSSPSHANRSTVSATRPSLVLFSRALCARMCAMAITPHGNVQDPIRNGPPSHQDVDARRS